MDIPGDQYKHWTPNAQEKVAERLRDIVDAKWKPFYCPRPGCDGNPHIEGAQPECSGFAPHLWEQVKNRWYCSICKTQGTPTDGWLFRHARANQHPPKGGWLTWLNRGGRGSGKTRTGSEWTHRMTKIAPRIALVAMTGPDGRDIMVEGESGLLATAKPGEAPEWEPSKKRVTWPNGAQATVFSGEEPDRLRGPQHYAAWLDEPAHIDLIEAVWDNLLFGLRLGRQPRICCTTTPVPTPWIKDLVKDPLTVSVVASTYANIHNLAPIFAGTILKRYEGTRKGRQEIHGEILADVEGALWNYDMLEPYRIAHGLAEYDRIVVSIDPAGTQRKKSDDTGIVVVAAKNDQFYVLQDASGKYSPKGWADRAVGLYEQWSADVIVVETNYGGDMVRSTLENVDQSPRIEEVTSRRGKVIRADPIVALYEKARVHHVGENLTDLEDQLVSWIPGTESPDRLDALVHGITSLAKIADPASVEDPRKLTNAMLPGADELDPALRARLSLVRNIPA